MYDCVTINLDSYHPESRCFLVVVVVMVTLALSISQPLLPVSLSG